MTVEVGRARRVVRDHAGACLVHDLDTVFLDAREDEASVVAGHFVLLHEPQPLGPERDARLDGIDDEHGRERAQ